MAENELTQIIELTESLTPADDDYLPIQALAGGTGSTKRTSIAAIRDGVSFATYQRTLFVAKHGADSNAGTNPTEPLLTLDAATTAAAALSPTTSDRVAIVALGAGIYTETVTLPSFVGLDARMSLIDGTLTIGEHNLVHLWRLRATADGQTLINKTSGTGNSAVHISEVDGRGDTGTRDGVLCIDNQSGILKVNSDIITVGLNGEGLGDGSPDFGHTHVHTRDLYAGGNGATLIRGSGGDAFVVVFADHILEIGTLTGTTGIRISGPGDVTVITGQLKMTGGDAYNISGPGLLRLQAMEVEGNRVGDATIEFADDRITAGNLPTSSAGLPTGAFWNDSGTLKVVT
jgi:hypothetical protein